MFLKIPEISMMVALQKSIPGLFCNWIKEPGLVDKLSALFAAAEGARGHLHFALEGVCKVCTV